MRQGLLVVAAMPAELPDRLGELGASSLVIGVGGPDATLPALPGTGAVLVTGALGALLPGTRRGELVLADAVADAEGTLRPSKRLREALALAAGQAGLSVRGGTIAQSDVLVDVAAGRAELARRTGATHVDMESARVARACEAAGRPWAVLRLVTDTPERPLSWLAELMAGELGRQPGVARVLARLARRPQHAARLVALGVMVARGRRGIREVVELLPP